MSTAPLTKIIERCAGLTHLCSSAFDPAYDRTGGKMEVWMPGQRVHAKLLADSEIAAVRENWLQPKESPGIARAWALRGWSGIAVMFPLSPDGESVFEFFHTGFQILNFSPLLLDEEHFNPA